MPEPTISYTINHLSIIATQLMKVMTPFLIFPTTIMTSMISCHQISFAKKMNKPILHLKGKGILHLKGKVDLMKKPILHLKGTLNSIKKLILDLKVWIGSGIGASGSIDTNPGPAIPPNDETTFSSLPMTRPILSNLSL
jgi:hypothetical protein